MSSSPTPSTLDPAVPCPSTNDTMPARDREARFVEQAEIARIALQQLVTVKDFVNADATKLTTMTKAIEAMVSHHLFVLSFLLNAVFSFLARI